MRQLTKTALSFTLLAGILLAQIPCRGENVYAAENSEENSDEKTEILEEDALPSSDNTNNINRITDSENTDEIVTNTDTSSKYYIPDKVLYNILIKEGDSNKDGILTLNEAAEITNIILSDSNIQDFTGFSTVVKNLTHLDITGISEVSEDNICAELTELEELSSLTFDDSENTKVVSVLSELKNLKELHVNNVYSGHITNYERMTELEVLELNYHNVTSASQMVALNLSEFSKLNTLHINGRFRKITFPDDKDNLHCVYINTDDKNNTENNIGNNIGNKTDNNNKAGNKNDSADQDDNSVITEIDLSQYTSLNNIYIYGYYSTVILPETTVNNNDEYSQGCLELYDYDMEQAGTVKNLDKLSKDIATINITNYNIADLSDIKAYENLSELYLISTGLKSTEGIGNLINLTHLTIQKNEGLTTLDAGIANLKKLHYLYLNYNAIENLPDMSSIFTKDGMLWDAEGDSYYSVWDNRMSLEGNRLTEEEILSSGIAKEFTRSIQWMALSTTAHYKANNTYYTYFPELSEKYVAYYLQNKENRTLRTNSDFTLSEELLHIIMEENCSLNIYRLDEALDDSYIRYTISKNTLENDWDGESSITLGDIDINIKKANVNGWKKYFTATPLAVLEIEIPKLQGISVDWSVNKSLDAKLNLEDEYLYRSYYIDKESKDYYSDNIYKYDGGIHASSAILRNKERVIAITDIDVACNHNISDIVCGFKTDTYSYHSVIRPNIVTEGEGKNIELMDSNFAKKIEDAEEGDTLSIVSEAGTYVDKEHFQMLSDKQLKVNVTGLYSSYSEDTITYGAIGSVTTYDFSNINKEITGGGTLDYYNVLQFGKSKTASEYAPDKLYDTKKHATMYSTWSKETEIYVKDSIKNGTKIYVYEQNDEENELELVGVTLVENGYIKVNLGEDKNYILVAGEELTKTTWDDSEENVNEEKQDRNSEQMNIGDINQDGETDIKDSALLKRYLAGWEVEIDTSVADINADGAIDIKDSALLKRYLAGWEIEIRE